MADQVKKRKGVASVAAAEIPEKLYFKIGEVSKLTGVEAYILRFWEREFPMLKPSKTKSNQRIYKREDIELILEIKRLLYEEKFTIEGARRYLAERGKEKPQQLSLNLQEKDLRDALNTVKGELGKIKALLKNLEM